MVCLQEKDAKLFKQYGGADGIAKKLNSSIQDGIKSSTVAERIEAFGPNKMPSLPPKGFLSMVWEQLQDPTLIMLVAAATVSYTIRPSCFASIEYTSAYRV